MQYFKFISITLLIFSTLVGNAGAQVIQSEMSCKLKDQIVINMIDGKTKRFSGYEDDLNVGDIIPLKYSFDTTRETLRMVMKDGAKGDMTDAINNELFWIESVKNKKLNHFDFYGVVMFSEDSTRNFGKNRFGDEYVAFSRYYKDDWQGITQNVDVNQQGVVESEIRMWSCQHKVASKFDEIFNLLLKKAK